MQIETSSGADVPKSLEGVDPLKNKKENDTNPY